MDIEGLKKALQQRGKEFLRFSRTLGSSPRQDWRVLIWGTGFLAIIVLALGAWLFIRVSSGEFAAVAPENPARVETLDRGRLMEVLEQLDERETQLEELEEESPSVVDPSE